MAQGGRSDQARQLAAERREADRLVREAARQSREQQKARQAEHVAKQERLAETRTAALTEEINLLEKILVNALNRPTLSFAGLKAKFEPPPFQPGTLATPPAEPTWQQYAPVEPRGIGRLFGGMSQYHRTLAQARRSFETATVDFQRAEGERLRKLAVAQAEHHRKVEEARAGANLYNNNLDARRQGFVLGEAEAVEWFVDKVLRASMYPKSFPRKWQVAYRPENRDVVVEFELPAQQVVPNVREYRYVKSRDSVDPVSRPVTEVKQRYARLIASMALRTLHEIFRSTPTEVVEAVVFNGRVSTTDRATGKKARPHLISVEAERSAFADLNLAEVDPAACLKYLNALVSPNPFDLEAVEPFIAFDLRRFRFVDAADELAGLDSRRNLMKLSPTEFEHLVKDLFAAMGAQAWRTVPSKDGGVDAVATSKNLFFGGVCLIQAKRWTKLVGLDAVHALTGVMTDHNATTGVLVTTSWFSRTSEQFAQRNRITLINGAELKHLIKEHLGFDVIPGTSPPTRIRASDNNQTGRPGPGR
ncbi:restriction endonuclease [Micromonospora arborensis]|uniref:restriction endonuclease n=1 Tax=Micromonospora arborensis TaxID=2116518 RepID=UPI00343B6EFA